MRQLLVLTEPQDELTLRERVAVVGVCAAEDLAKLILVNRYCAAAAVAAAAAAALCIQVSLNCTQLARDSLELVVKRLRVVCRRDLTVKLRLLIASLLLHLVLLDHVAASLQVPASAGAARTSRQINLAHASSRRYAQRSLSFDGSVRPRVRCASSTPRLARARGSRGQRVVRTSVFDVDEALS